MQATSPLREAKDIMEGIGQFQLQKCDSLFSAAVLDDFLIWQNDKSDNLYSMNYDYRTRARRQNRRPQYLENGSFYIFKPENLRRFNNRLSGKIGMSLMPLWKSFEIDTPEDLFLCELLFKEKLLYENEVV